MKSINPFTGELLKEFKNQNYEECIKKLDNSQKAFQEWKNKPISYRSKILKKVSQQLKKEKKQYATLISKEMGKPISESIKEIEKCAWVCEYFADNSAKFLKDEIIKTEAKKSYVRFEPLGVIFGIMPWNFPFWQVFRFAVPALMAGNACIIKHASNVPMCSTAIDNIFNKTGMRNILQNFLIDSETAMMLIERNEIKGVSLTGSVGAGREIAEKAGKNLKKVVLELGGSDPFIVLKDANLKSCCATAVSARMLNTGQSCIAAKRMIVVKDIAKEFETLFVDNVKSLKMGNPLEETTNIGPLAKPELIVTLDNQVKDAIKKGGKILCGGYKNRNFYLPTVITNVNEGMAILKEETFGPVIPIIIVKDEAAAIKEANRTNFGLGASIWTTNLIKADKLAKEIESGNVFVNGMVRSDPRMPFGGMKDSGFGRELSHYGIKEFTNIKSIVINK